MLPETVVMASPSRMLNSENKSPSSNNLNSSAVMTPPRTPFLYKSSSPPGVTLPSGFSFGFYKSPKSIKTPAEEPPHFSPLRKPIPVPKKRNDTINKGVGHKIKKPKLKAKDLKKKHKKASHIIHTMKHIKPSYQRIAGNRISDKTPPGTKKKFHMLSSPGVSLLDSPELGSDFMPDHKNKKFFTSRSRAAATVQINKTIKLSAIYGDITLHRDHTNIPKKNIGLIVEDELQSLLDKENDKIDFDSNFALPLPSLLDPGTPSAPTRVISSPSPKKKQTNISSPRKLFNPSGQNLGQVEISPSKRSLRSSRSPIKVKGKSPQKKIETNNSPSKSPSSAKKMSTPVKNIPLRTSPRKHQSPSIKNILRVTTSRSTSPKSRSPGKILTPKKYVGSNSTPRKSLYMSPRNRRSPARHPEYHLSHIEDNCVCCSPGKTSISSPKRSLSRFGSQSSNRSPRRTHRTSPTNSPKKFDSSPKKTSNLNNNNIDKLLQELEDLEDSCDELQDLDKALQLLETKEIDKATVASPKRKSPRKQQNNEVKKPTGFKYFPIFDPSKRLSDKKENNAFSPTTRVRNKRISPDDEKQAIIDAGQRKFGHTQCNVCGVVYEFSNLGDEACHMKFHNGFLNSLKFPGWKNERIAMESDLIGGRIIKITATDPSNWWKKVDEIRDLVDQDLGFAENVTRVKDQTIVFLYIMDRRVAGCLIAEFIDSAHRIIPDKKSTVKVLCCSEESVKTTVGVSRIWVAPSYRRKGIATNLVTAMRRNIYTSHFLTVDQFAFSDPTESGLNFGRKYTGKQDFLVYRH